MQTDTRMFIGETSGQAFDGFAGFRIGQVYELRYTRLGDGTVAVELDHSPGAEPLVVQETDFGKWWAKK